MATLTVSTIGMLVGASYLAMALYLTYSRRVITHPIFPAMFLVGGASLILISNWAVTIEALHVTIPALFTALLGYLIAFFGGVGGFLYLTRWSGLCHRVTRGEVEAAADPSRRQD